VDEDAAESLPRSPIRAGPSPPSGCPLIAFHEAKGILGVGDLHPGGAAATERILDWLEAAGAHRIVEVGAGIGCTTARLVQRGFDPVALEPNPRLFARLADRVGPIARSARCEDFRPAAPVDAIVAESVLYGTDLRRVTPHLRGWLRPGGVLLHADLVWRPGVSAESARRIHDQTLARHGIPVASREPWTWPDWVATFEAAGFRLERAERLGPSRDARPAAADIVRHPLAALALLQQRIRRPRLDPRSFESWVACWVATGEPA
jgi:SAM-dependent methyltransferase